jgi:hypothetical protein
MNYTSNNPAPVSARWMPTCTLCNKPVQLETCNTDESGKAIHEECYIRKVVRLKQTNRAIVQLPGFLGHYRIQASSACDTAQT